MKNLTIRSVALLALLAVVAVPGLTSSRLAAQAAGAGTAQRAAAANRNDQDRWESTIKKFEDTDKVTPPPQNAIVFIGASSIVRWNLPDSFPELGPQAINRGFGGSLAADSTRYAERIVIPYKPRIVVFYAGDNDVEANHTPEQIAGDFMAFERKVHAALPATQIIFISIKPSIRRWPWIDEFNHEWGELLAEMPESELANEFGDLVENSCASYEAYLDSFRDADEIDEPLSHSDFHLLEAELETLISLEYEFGYLLPEQQARKEQLAEQLYINPDTLLDDDTDLPDYPDEDDSPFWEN